MNVPETMNEVLDMSDDEGMALSWRGCHVMTDRVSVASRRQSVTYMFGRGDV